MAIQTPAAPEINPRAEKGTWKIQTLDETERLAMYIVGAMALHYPDISAAIAELDSQQTNHVWEDIADMIKDALPSLDMIELQRFHDSPHRN